MCGVITRCKQAICSNTSKYIHNKALQKSYSYTACVINCQTPLITKHCNNPRPAELLREFMNVSMESNYAQLKAVHKAHLFPDNCRAFAPLHVPTVEAFKDEQPSLYGHVDVAHFDRVISGRWPESQRPGFSSYHVGCWC